MEREARDRTNVDTFGEDHVENFRYVHRTPVEHADDFSTEDLRGVFDWWGAQASVPPRRANFDICDHAHLAPHAFLIRVLDRGRFEYVLQGEEVIHLVGRRQNGILFGPESTDPAQRAMAGYFQTVIDSRRAWRCAGTLAMFGKEHLDFESIDCPLMAESGRAVSHLIGFMYAASLHGVSYPETLIDGQWRLPLRPG
jgi:hypothetical protein